MVTKEDLKEKIEEQLAKWKSTIDGLKVSFEHAEVDVKAKLHDQLESLHDKRVKAEKLLEDVSATSQDAWEQIKSGADQGWSDLTRAAKSTMDKVRDAMARPKRDDEIRQIAYHLWRDEGCPDGRQLEHWTKAESIWHARQNGITEPVKGAPAKAKRPRKKPATPATSKSRTQNPKRVPTKSVRLEGKKRPSRQGALAVDDDVTHNGNPSVVDPQRVRLRLARLKTFGRFPESGPRREQHLH